MCKSVRGAAFFGSSIHLALSFIFLFWFVFDTLINEININLWKCDPPEQKFKDIEPLAHYLNLFFKLLYFTVLCITGVYIFRGVERERPRLLKFATLAFIILQFVGVVLFSVFFSIQWNAEPDPNPARYEAASLVASEEIGGIMPNESQIDEQGEIPVIPVPVKIPDMISTVTPPTSENVLPAPETNEATTTTTPMPVINTTTTTTTVTSTTTVLPPTSAMTTTEKPQVSPPCLTLDCPHAPPPPPPPPPRRRLPHNQLVSLVFQMCLAITNGLGSIVYVVVLALYMLKL